MKLESLWACGMDKDRVEVIRSLALNFPYANMPVSEKYFNASFQSLCKYVNQRNLAGELSLVVDFSKEESSKKYFRSGSCRTKKFYSLDVEDPKISSILTSGRCEYRGLYLTVYFENSTEYAPRFMVWEAH